MSMQKSNYDLLLNTVDEGDISKVIDVLKYISPNDHDGHRQSALISAADSGNIDMFKCLLDHGADVNYDDEAGDSPLICAAVIGSIEIVKLCIENGAELNKKNRFGVTALEYAEEHGQKEIVVLLKSYHTGNN